MTKRWQLIVEITLDIEGDETPEDAVWRAKPFLERMFWDGTERDRKIAHYHILGMPKHCVEFD